LAPLFKALDTVRLYKYLPTVFSQALLNRGSIRIGTLSDFRKSEHSPGISDPTEGTKIINLDIGEEEKYECLTEAPEGLKGFIKITGECKNLTLNEIHTTTKYRSEDVYILCLSSEASVNVMNSLEGAEECLELLYQEEFFRDLNIIMSMESAKFDGLSECIYQSRVVAITSGRESTGPHPSIIKEPEFKAQKEIRAIWIPTNNKIIHPTTINNSNLGEYFRKVSV